MLSMANFEKLDCPENLILVKNMTLVMHALIDCKVQRNHVLRWVDRFVN